MRLKGAALTLIAAAGSSTAGFRADAYSLAPKQLYRRRLHGTIHGRRVRLFGVKAPDQETEVVGSENRTEPQGFVNKGPMAWMDPYLDLMGIEPGKKLNYGPLFPQSVDESDRVSTEEQEADRQRAARDLVNINQDERDRRAQASKLMAAVSVGYIFWASVIADDGGISGHLLRLASALPLFFAVGYKLSADTGL